MENKESFAILIVFALIAVVLFAGGTRLLKNFVGSIPSSKPTNQDQETLKKQYKNTDQIRRQQKEEMDRMKRQTDDLKHQMDYQRHHSRLNKTMMNNLTHLMKQRNPRFMETLLLASDNKTSDGNLLICKLKKDSDQTLSKIATKSEQNEQQRNMAREQRRLNEERKRHEREMEKLRREHNEAMERIRREQQQQKIQQDLQKRQMDLEQRQQRDMLRRIKPQ